ncbi:MAG: hypothetical protein DI598_00310 [Pseudopedobacter saltans]|uniref:Carboxypeptidase-like regulatory domain-containing protein n=1 Tax=Pseudopedobacter saltans TaxID=151895 RepID=A0A2W5HFV2_9SPHI|nr:MAG: hypothetical protein DI598_00310 [Pseudopedobacter saltans]
MKKVSYILFLLTSILFCSETAFAQNRIEGNVYDETHYVPIPNVEVMTSSGYHTKTDSVGNYNIQVQGKKDSVWFSYKGKNTLKYPIDTVKYTYQFNIGLSVKSPLKDDKHWLTPVTVYNKSYRQYSIENRLAYDKIFNPDKGGFRLGTAPQGTFGVGVDLDALINSFRFAYNKRQDMYRRDILEEERYKYVSYRFNRKLVSELTQLDSSDLNVFMKEYRPEYFPLTMMNDADLGKYIEESKNAFISRKNRVFNDPFSQMFKNKSSSN